MRVPLTDLATRFDPLRAELDAAIGRVLDRGMFVLGKEVAALETALTAYTGAQHAIGCASGSDALLLALMALDIGAGDQVIVPSLTFISTATAVSRLGAEVVFADVDPASLTLDPESVADAASRCPNLRAVVLVHLFGHSPESDALRAVAERHGAALVHDAAQALGARNASGAPPGASGELTAFSFYPTKNLGALGDAGLVTTSHAQYADRIRSLRVHGTERIDRPSAIGFNSRLDEIHAAALNVLLVGIDEQVRRRNECADDYDLRFAGSGAAALGVRVPARPATGATHAFHHYVVRLPAQRRDDLASALGERGIETARYYQVPLHQLPGFARAAPRDADLSETEGAARETLALPVHPSVGASQRSYVVESVVDLLSA